jgi:transcription-repair coupling factor (superfamily II helicase)
MEEELGRLVKQKYAVVILAGLRRHGQPLADAIAEMGMPVRYVDTLENTAAAEGMVTVSKGVMNAGFEYPDLRLAVLTQKKAAAF